MFIFSTDLHELEEYFIDIPPELCHLKVVGFSKDMGSSWSLLPSLMHRLENLLVAIQLKDRLSNAFPEGNKVKAQRVFYIITCSCFLNDSLASFTSPTRQQPKMYFLN